MRAAGDAVQGRRDAGVHGGRRFRGHRVRNRNATVPVRRASDSDGRRLRRQEERVGRSEQGALRLGRAWHAGRLRERRAWRQQRELATAQGRGVRGTRPWFAARWARGDRRVGADFGRADRRAFHSGATPAAGSGGHGRGWSRGGTKRERGRDGRGVGGGGGSGICRCSGAMGWGCRRGWGRDGGGRGHGRHRRNAGSCEGAVCAGGRTGATSVDGRGRGSGRGCDDEIGGGGRLNRGAPE